MDASTAWPIRKLLDEYGTGSILLPEMQRSYVWRKTQARDLLDSIYKGYPSGSILLWEIDETSYETRDAAIKIDEKSKQQVRYLLLDGQQRLTSLASMINGIPVEVKVGHRTKAEHIDVYFNLNHPDSTSSFEENIEDIDDDDDLIDYEEKDVVDPEKLVFHQKSKKIENKKNWIPVTELFHSTVSEAVRKINKDDENYDKFLDRISDLHKVKDSYEYPIQIIPKTKNYMEVTEIFVRVNSSGARLRASDLALAQITSRWPGSLKNEFLPFRKACDDVNFVVDEGDMIKFLIAISVGKNKFELINKIPTQKLKENWPKTQKAIQYSLNFLKQNAYIETKEFLAAKFLLIPIGCFAKKVDYSLTDKMQKNLLRWFYAATMWGRYSRGATETALDEDLNAIYKNDDSIEQMIKNVLKASGRLEVKESDLQGVNVRNPFFVMSYVSAKTNHAKDWKTGLEISVQSFGKAFKNEYDHIFPQAKLKPFLEKKYDKSKTKSMVNDIGNICFLQKVPNIKKSDKLPEEYLPGVVENWGEEALSAQNITLDKSLWSLDMYEKFLEDRRQKIAGAINNLMNSLG